MIAKSAYVCLFVLAAGCAPVDNQGLADNSAARTDAIESPIADGDYILHTAVSGKCLDVSGASAADGANVQEWQHFVCDRSAQET